MAKDNLAIIKREKRKDWEKSNYIPKENVVIICDNEDGSISLMVGNGKNKVLELPDILKEKQKPIVNENTLLL